MDFYNLIDFELYPFSFAEYVRFRGIKPDPLTTKGISFLKQAYADYLEHGGFPELFQIGQNQKKIYIQTLLQSILYKDILQRFTVKYAKALGDIFNWSVENYSREINCTGIAKMLGIRSVHTVQNYLDYLGQAYLALKLTKFSFQAGERLRSQKNFLVDMAFITHGTSELSGDHLGYQLENVVYLELLRRRTQEDYEVYFYKKDYEVDFVLVRNRQVLRLIQVSYDIGTHKARKRELNALLKGSVDLQCDELLLITQSQSENAEVDGKSIRIIPIVEWLLQPYSHGRQRQRQATE